MGKRKGKSRKPVGPKKREPLATQFTCLFCNHEKAVQVKLDKKTGIGDLYCKVCGQKFQSSINYLSAAVDVYSDWLDACESVAQDAVAQEVTEEDKRFSSYATERPRATATAGDGEEEDGGYDDDE